MPLALQDPQIMLFAAPLPRCRNHDTRHRKEQNRSGYWRREAAKAKKMAARALVEATRSTTLVAELERKMVEMEARTTSIKTELDNVLSWVDHKADNMKIMVAEAEDKAKKADGMQTAQVADLQQKVDTVEAKVTSNMVEAEKCSRATTTDLNNAKIWLAEATREATRARKTDSILLRHFAELQKKVDTVEAKTTSIMAMAEKCSSSTSIDLDETKIMAMAVTKVSGELQKKIEILQHHTGMGPAASTINAVLRGYHYRRHEHRQRYNADMIRVSSIITAAMRGCFCRRRVVRSTLMQMETYWVTKTYWVQQGRWRWLKTRCKCLRCARDYLSRIAYHSPLPNWEKARFSLRHFLNPGCTRTCTECGIILQ